MTDIKDRMVYLVEDDDALRRTTSRMLQASGCAVRDYPSGECFLDELATAEPGCVLLDIRMPGMSGLRVQEVMAERRVMMSVIMLTGSSDVADAVVAMKAGAVDYIQKPFCREDLVTALEAAFDRLDRQMKSAARVSEAAGRLAALSPREREVLEKLGQGLQNKVVAYQLGLSARTVEAYRAMLMRKLGVRSFAEALRIRIEAGEPHAGESSAAESATSALEPGIGKASDQLRRAKT